MSTDIKTLSERIKPNAWLTPGETGNILTASMQEASELRTALETELKRVNSYKTLMEAKGKLHARQQARISALEAAAQINVEAVETLASERAANAILTAELAATQAPSAPVAADERADFEAWKGYELPALNNHGQFHQDWLHREFVAFNAGKARAALSVKAGTAAIPGEAREPSEAEWKCGAEARMMSVDSYKRLVRLGVAAATTPPTTGATCSVALAQQIASAQAEVATWPEGKLARIKAAGGDQK